MWQMVRFLQKMKTQQQQNKKIKHENPCQSRELNPGHLALKADALPLHHRGNCEYRWSSSYFTVSMQWVEM